MIGVGIVLLGLRFGYYAEIGDYRNFAIALYSPLGDFAKMSGFLPGVELRLRLRAKTNLKSRWH